MKKERARCTRANLTRAFLRRMETHTPDVVRRMEIQILMNTTADAFGEKSESVMALPADGALRKYTSCTEIHSSLCRPQNKMILFLQFFHQSPQSKPP